MLIFPCDVGVPWPRVDNALTALDAVLECLAIRRLDEFYPAIRPQSFPDTVHTVRIASSRNLSWVNRRVDEVFGRGFRSKPNVLFRDLSFSALEQSMAFFVSGISPSSSDGNEFGPGIYTPRQISTSRATTRDGMGRSWCFATLTTMG